ATPDHISRLVESQSAADAILRRLYERDENDLDDELASRWSEIDARFHGTILSAAGNPLIQRHATDVRFLRQIWCRRLDAKVFDVRAVLTQSLRDHGRIIAAIKRHDADAARAAMSAHVQ